MFAVIRTLVRRNRRIKRQRSNYPINLINSTKSHSRIHGRIVIRYSVRRSVSLFNRYRKITATIVRSSFPQSFGFIRKTHVRPCFCVALKGLWSRKSSIESSRCIGDLPTTLLRQLHPALRSLLSRSIHESTSTIFNLCFRFGFLWISMISSGRCVFRLWWMM